MFVISYRAAHLDETAWVVGQSKLKVVTIACVQHPAVSPPDTQLAFGKVHADEHSGDKGVEGTTGSLRHVSDIKFLNGPLSPRAFQHPLSLSILDRADKTETFGWLNAPVFLDQ